MFRTVRILHTCIALTLAMMLTMSGALLPSSVPGAASTALAQDNDFRLVVNVGSGVANDTAIELQGSDFEVIDWFVDGDYGGYVTSDGVHIIVEAPGTVVAILKQNGKAFDVEVNGFQFENFVNDHSWQDDLGTDDVFNLFGPDVCQSGDTADTCKLSGAAETWRVNTIKDMGLGHCDGMASASLSLFTRQPFKGISKPGDIQSGASNTIDLNFPGETIENYIVGQMSFQYTEEYWDKVITKKPSEIVKDLTTAFNATPPVAYELTIEKVKNPPMVTPLPPMGSRRSMTTRCAFWSTTIISPKSVNISR